MSAATGTEDVDAFPAAAAATAQALSNIGAAFMSDPGMRARGHELGFEGIDFYFSGRAGVLGEIDASVATAALVFFDPDVVAEAWARSEGVMPRRAAAVEFAAFAARWAEAHLGDIDDAGNAVDWDQLLALTERIVDAAPVALSPIFAGWMTLPKPDGTKRRTTHAMNALREYRMSRHAAALLAHGVGIEDAVRHRQPTMTSMFGWRAGPPAEVVVDRWEAAEALTDRLVGQAYAVLDERELQSFVALATSAARSIRR